MFVCLKSSKRKLRPERQIITSSTDFNLKKSERGVRQNVGVSAQKVRGESRNEQTPTDTNEESCGELLSARV